MSNGENKQQLAEERTDWAEDRTLLANERTFAGWMRTGLASVAVAIGLRAVFGPFEPTWAAKAVASLFVIAAIVIYWSARHTAVRAHERLSAQDAEPVSGRGFTRLAAVLTVATLGVGIVLWLL